jgi:biofilm PGA synthesis protein PgaD
MIIITRCSRLALTVDILSTAAWWAGFLYLLGTGIPGMNPGASLAQQIQTSIQLLPTLRTLFIYVAIGVLCSLLFVLWVRYYRHFSRGAWRSGKLSPLDDSAVASSFRLSRHLLHKLRESRWSVIHHDPDGDIAILVIDVDTPQPPSNSETFELTRAA